MQSNVHIMNHPLVTHKITRIRDIDTDTYNFRKLVYEIALLIGYEATKELQLKEVAVTTPMMETTQKVLDAKVAIVPILDLVPSAHVGHIGLQRNEETLEPEEYYCKLPLDIAEREVLVVDPMLATGGSSAAAIDFIKQRGAKNIKFLCIIAAPEGLKKMQEAHPDVKIFCGALDEKLNEKGYILPGLGDAGDRIFGTL